MVRAIILWLCDCLVGRLCKNRCSLPIYIHFSCELGMHGISTCNTRQIDRTGVPNREDYVAANQRLTGLIWRKYPKSGTNRVAARICCVYHLTSPGSCAHSHSAEGCCLLFKAFGRCTPVTSYQFARCTLSTTSIYVHLCSGWVILPEVGRLDYLAAAACGNLSPKYSWWIPRHDSLVRYKTLTDEVKFYTPPSQWPTGTGYEHIACQAMQITQDT